MGQQFGSALSQDLCLGKHIPESVNHVVMPLVIIKEKAKWKKHYPVSRVNFCKFRDRDIWLDSYSVVSKLLP